MRLYDSAVAPVRRAAPNRPSEAGEDQRVETTGLASHPHHQSFSVITEETVGFDLARDREVEVQAFLTEGTVAVALFVSGPFGSGTVLATAQEARAVALALLRAADDADRLRSGEEARV